MVRSRATWLGLLAVVTLGGLVYLFLDVTADAELAEEMALASKYYDGNDYEAAQKQALRVLAKEPENTRMLRVVVSSACMMGDADTATKYFPSLPAGRDQRDMVKRCSRYEITLPEPKQVYPKGGSRGPRGGGDTPIR